MQKLLVCLGMIVVMGGSAVWSAAGDFRNVTWGMSRAEVIAQEGADPAKEGMSLLGTPYLAYPAKMKVGSTTHTMIAGYYFVDDQCYFGKYVIQTEHSNDNEFLTDFDALHTALSKKYGPAIQDDTIWKDDCYKDDPSKWGWR